MNSILRFAISITAPQMSCIKFCKKLTAFYHRGLSKEKQAQTGGPQHLEQKLYSSEKSQS
jgi:hypothetical protein